MIGKGSDDMKGLKYVLISLYVVFVLLITICIFNFSTSSSSRFGNTMIAYVKEDVGKFKSGSLVIGKNNDIKKNDDILYYDTVNGKNILKITKVNRIMKKSDITYVIDDGLFLSSEYVVGKVDNIKSVILMGYLYIFFTNSIVYFLTIVLPILIYFIYLFRSRKKYA